MILLCEHRPVRDARAPNQHLRKQKTDKRDAAHILKLLLEGRFPRLWTPDREQRDLRQLVLHRSSSRRGLLLTGSAPAKEAS